MERLGVVFRMYGVLKGCDFFDFSKLLENNLYFGYFLLFGINLRLKEGIVVVNYWRWFFECIDNFLVLYFKKIVFLKLKGYIGMCWILGRSYSEGEVNFCINGWSILIFYVLGLFVEDEIKFEVF